MKKIFIIGIALFLLLLSAVSADDADFKISLDKNRIPPGRQARLYMTFFDKKGMPVPEIPLIEGLVFEHVSSEEKDITVNGREAPSTVHTFKVIPLKEGSYTIGPLYVARDNKRYASNKISLDVSREYLAPRETPQAAAYDLSKRIYLEFNVPKTRIFVNEKLDVILNLFSDWLDIEDIRVSSLSSDYLVSEDFKKMDVRLTEIGGTRYAVLPYHGWFFAPEAGAYTIPAVKVNLYIAKKRAPEAGSDMEVLNRNEDFYDSYIGMADGKSIELETEPLNIVVRPLPSAGRPADFTGAVGNFNFDTEVNPLNIKAGETVALTMGIGGKGNFRTVRFPLLPDLKDAKVYDPQITVTAEAVISEQILRPISADFREIPRLTFSFFDPDMEKYVTLEKGPIAVNVAPVAAGEKPVEKEKEKAKEKKEEAEDIVGIKGFSGKISGPNPYFYKNVGFIFLQILPIIAVLLAALIYRRMRIIETNPVYAGWLLAGRISKAGLDKAKRFMEKRMIREFYDTLFKVMREYLGARLALPAAGITGAITSSFKDAEGEDCEGILAIKKIFSDCYMARFTGIPFSEEDMKRSFDETARVIDYLHKKGSL